MDDFGFFHFATVATVIGCGTGIILTIVDKIFGGRKGKAEAETRLAAERTRMLETQVVELRRQNELLQQQLAWHTKLLEAQERPTGRPAETAGAR